MNATEAMNHGHAVARAITGRDDDDYYSIANEAVVHAIRTHDEARGATLKTHIGTCVRNALYREFERDAYRETVTIDAAAMNVAGPREVPHVFDLIAKLPGHMIDLACDYWRGHMTFRDLAVKHDCSTSTIQKRIDRVRHRLKRILDDEVCNGWPETSPAFG